MKTNLQIVLFLMMLATSLALSGQTTIPAGSVSGTWNLAGSPYLVQGGVFVPNGSTLTIQPGVTVNFQGHYKLLVLGRVLAVGTQADSIYFTAADTSLGWYGIRFDNTSAVNDSSKFFYCSVKSGKANGSGNDAYGGAFMFNNFSKAIISNCRISGNSYYSIYCVSSNPKLLNNKIQYNVGGGISNNNFSSPLISGNTISNNYGPGISGGADVIIYNNTISYNSGVGIYLYNGATVSYNTISHNISNFWAGGIYMTAPGTSLITHNIISYNVCTNSGYGGGIFCYSGNNTITYNIITNNSSPVGGGIYCLQNDPIVSNNLIANNTATSASGKGGGILCNNNNPTIINNTIVNNSAPQGGGIYFIGSTNPSIYNCIFYGNKASADGNEVYLQDQTCAPDFHYCDIQGGTGAFGLNGNVYIGNYSNNINSDPLFISTSAGIGNGYNGLTADWSLQAVSPCINTGNPSGSYPSTDLAGNARVYGSSIDIGAYELQSSLGETEYNLNDDFFAYPNPCKGNLTVKADIKGQCFLRMVDISGREILNKDLTGLNEIDLSAFDNGIYYLTINNGSRSFIKKIVLLK